MSDLLIDDARAEKLSDVLKALAHPVRLRIVRVLCDRDERVTELAEVLAEKQAIVSQQLRILRMSGLVHVKKEGGASRYSLLEPRLVDLLSCLDGCRRE